jgi:hypothetical protein
MKLELIKLYRMVLIDKWCPVSSSTAPNGDVYIRLRRHTTGGAYYSTQAKLTPAGSEE